VKKKFKVEVCRGVLGYAIYVDDRRMFGPKPWGGGNVVASFSKSIAELDDLIVHLNKVRGNLLDANKIVVGDFYTTSNNDLILMYCETGIFALEWISHAEGYVAHEAAYDDIELVVHGESVMPELGGVIKKAEEENVLKDGKLKCGKRDVAFLNKVIRNGGFEAYIKKLEGKDEHRKQ